MLVQVAFGGLAVASKFALPFVPPLALAFCRLASAAFVLVAVERLLVRSRMPPGKDLAKFALFALLGVVLNQGLFLTGLRYTTATNAILLIATIPAFTLLVAVLLGHDKARPLKLAGLALSFCGVAVLVFGKGASFGRSDLVGDLLVVLNSLSYSTYLVLSRPTLTRYDPLTLISWVFVFGTVEMGLVAAPQLWSVDWRALTTPAWLGFTYAIVIGTIVAYTLNNWVLRHKSASHVASFVYLQPLVGALAAWWLLSERPGRTTLVAGALILAGVALAGRSVGQRAASPAE